MANMSSISDKISKISTNELNMHSFIQDRNSLFEKLKASQQQFLNEAKKSIKCTLPNGLSVSSISFEQTPKDLIHHLKSDKSFIVAKVNGMLWDLSRPLEEDSTIEYLTFDEPEGQYVFWHSSAHILGEALESYYAAVLCSGPPVEQGFYYDIFIGDRTVSGADLPEIEKLCNIIVKQKQPFERVVVKKEDLMELFKDNIFKLRILKEKVTEPFTTVYRCGNLIDLCRGPHLEHTGVATAFSIIKASATYWEGKSDAESLQRIYGITFPTIKRLNEWNLLQAEAAKRDHRKLGKEHELFFFHDLSPGSCFFLPKGAHIYNKLTEFLRGEYRKRGFTEVVSPNMFNVKLWKTSGHYQNYAENMFMLKVEDEQFALKPMNCPGHCLMYSMRPRSWKELPIRYADFGVLHRNEFSGALSGLTRVRRFCQDDAHIFCTLDQVGQEIKACLDFLVFVHNVLGFTISIQLSTRPPKSLGDDSIWERAEAELKKELDNFGHKWELNPGDGAFYGPKIDIHVKDALQRSHQVSTIQLDFNLPERFELKYINQNNIQEQPVMIHRAILGSLERVIGVLTESYGGKWPFWMSPNQVIIIPIKEQAFDYAYSLKSKLSAAGYAVDINVDSSETLDKKIRNATLSFYNFIFVIGLIECNKNTVSVRVRGGKKPFEKTQEEIMDHFKTLVDNFVIEDKEF